MDGSLPYYIAVIVIASLITHLFIDVQLLFASFSLSLSPSLLPFTNNNARCGPSIYQNESVPNQTSHACLLPSTHPCRSFSLQTVSKIKKEINIHICEKAWGKGKKKRKGGGKYNRVRTIYCTVNVNARPLYMILSA